MTDRREWRVSEVKDVDPARPLEADVVIHPDSATLKDFYETRPARILVSVAYCMKGSSCPHRQSDECDLGCTGCELAQLKQACIDQAMTFRIEVSNDQLMEFLDREAVRFDWIVGLACPYEITRLAPVLWDRYRLRQLIFPLASVFCASHTDYAPESTPGSEVKATTKISRMLELLVFS